MKELFSPVLFLSVLALPTSGTVFSQVPPPRGKQTEATGQQAQVIAQRLPVDEQRPQIGNTTIRRYLSGTDKDHTVSWDFFCTGGRNSGRWTKIPVPSCWELQGFGNYNYGHDKVKSDEQGLYKYSFQTEPSWPGKKVFLVFEGSMTDTRVSINGRSAGDIHQGSFYRFKYDITALLKAPLEKNELEVTVSKMSADTGVNKAERGNSDFWLFGGIYRPVYLEIVPANFIDRVAIDARADGSFQMDVFPVGIKGGEVLEAQVKKINGEPVGKPFSITATGEEDKLRLKASFANPFLWSPESPNLYEVVLSMKDNKKIVHRVSQRFGFRTVELRKNDGFYVNGVKILFKGCDRHSFWPETGRTLSHAVHLMDVKLMKEMNMNAVRMSHYPPDADFLNVCDSLGLYVLDELTGWQKAYDTVVGHKLVKEMTIRDVNHPSIVLWDNGNEGGWNRALDGDFALYDPQGRTVIHPFERFNNTNTKHYPDYPYLLNSVATEQDVFFPTEFMHGLYDGGAGAGLEDYWDLLLKHPHGAGGFIWALLDEAVVRTDKDGVFDTDGNHAPDGIVGPHREKEASFYTIKEIWSPVLVEAPVLDNTFTGVLNVTNRYSFTDLNQCRFSWKLVSFPGPAAPTTLSRVSAAGKSTTASILPGGRGTLALSLPADWAKSDALCLTAYGPDGKEIFSWTWTIKTPEEIRKSLFAGRNGSSHSSSVRRSGAQLLQAGVPGKVHDESMSAKAVDADSVLTVSCDGLMYFFDKTTGYLQKVAGPKTTLSLSGGPAPAGMNTMILTDFRYSDGKEGYEVSADYQGVGSLAGGETLPGRNTGYSETTGASLHIRWIFRTGLPVKLEYSYSQTGPVDFMGITFNYPEEKITGMKWLGRGPYRVWKNRLKGPQTGVWHKEYNDAVTGEDWRYPEFKGYHAEMNWVVIENKEIPFIVYTDSAHLYLQMLHPKRAKDAPDNVHTTPSFPEGSIGFLNAISPIGDKFHSPEKLGPQSQKTIADGKPVSGVLWFEFHN